MYISNMIPSLLQLISEHWFSYKTYKSVKLMSTLSTAPVYAYKFSLDGKLGLYKRLSGLQDFEGKVVLKIQCNLLVNLFPLLKIVHARQLSVRLRYWPQLSGIHSQS
jgi:hypothetical protein